MEPISLIVGALVTGAVSAASEVGGQALKEAYSGLRALIVARFKRDAAVAALEEDPSSDSQRKAFEEALAKADAARDPQVMNEAVTKAREITQILAREPADRLQAIGVRIGTLQAMNARFGEIEVSGAGTGVDIDKAELKGDFIVTNVKVHQPPN
ncbi:MAG: hypothetical protein ACJ8AW_01690 [Rhodopila sp.]